MREAGPALASAAEQVNAHEKLLLAGGIAHVHARERMMARTLPWTVLLLALSTVFVLGHEGRDLLYRAGHHGATTAGFLTISRNLSPEHNFLMFQQEIQRADGTRTYSPYGSFPVGGFALIKLAVGPFDGGLSQHLHAARMFMLLFFVGTAMLAYHSLARLLSNRWTALTATALTFSSTYFLYYADMVSTEVMDLCGVMLVFHGMVLFVQEGRLRQLWIKTAVALLVGWHVYALLLPFVLFGIAGDRPSVRRLPFSPHIRLGAFSLGFGMLVLGFNFANEYVAMNASSVADLQVYESMTRRLGMNESFNAAQADRLAWDYFLSLQFFRIGGMVLPFALYDHIPGPDASPSLPVVLLGIAMTGACVVCVLGASRYRVLAATLAAFGFVWSLTMRHHTFTHDWSAIFYLGIPLVVLGAVLQHAHRLYGNRLLVGAAAAAGGVFVLSGVQMGRVGLDEDGMALHREVVADFEAVRALTRGRTIGLYRNPDDHGFDGVPSSTMYYLAGHVTTGRSHADVLVTEKLEDDVGLITPYNRRVFLYDRRARQLADN